MFRYSLIMAAGKGERMLPFTKTHPKAMVEVDGKPLICFLLEQISLISEKVFITTGYNGHEITAYFLDKNNISFINTYHKGNAWWIFHSLMKDVDEPVLVSDCDILTSIDVNYIDLNCRNAGYPACLILPVKPVNGVEGDYLFGRKGKVFSFSRTQKSDIYSSGLQVINPYKINQLINKRAENISDVWNLLIEKGELYYAETYPHKWYSINTMEQLNEAKYYLPLIKKEKTCTVI